MASTYGYTTATKVKNRLENYDTDASDSMIETYITHAEGYINALTRHKFESDVPELVESIATDIAAIYLLTYNPAGFSSSSEAALLADLLWASAERSLRLLSDDRVISHLKGGG